MKDRLKSVITAIALINKKHPEKLSVNGSITCPQCNGILHYTKSGCNGHTHGRCETNGCLAWVQ